MTTTEALEQLAAHGTAIIGYGNLTLAHPMDQRRAAQSHHMRTMHRYTEMLHGR